MPKADPPLAENPKQSQMLKILRLMPEADEPQAQKADAPRAQKHVFKFLRSVV